LLVVLSNAERQRRFRQRRNAAAKGERLGEMAREAMDAAISAVWAIINRPSADGQKWAVKDRFADLEEWRVYWAKTARSGGLKELRKAFSGYGEDANEEERGALERAIEVLDAAMFSNVHVPEEPKRSRRR
jgi:hypothetical protein